MCDEPVERLAPEAFKAALLARGWNSEKLAVRWELTRRRLDQLISDPDRPRYYEDALRGLPVRKWSRANLPDDMSEGEFKLIERLERAPLPLIYKRDGWAPERYPRGVSKQDFKRLLQRSQSLVKIELGILQLDE